MPDNATPTFAQSEPVVLSDAIRSLLLAVLALLQVFGLNITAEQSGAILLVYIAASAVLTVYTRSKTTPTPATREADAANARDGGQVPNNLVWWVIAICVLIILIWFIFTRIIDVEDDEALSALLAWR